MPQFLVPTNYRSHLEESFIQNGGSFLHRVEMGIQSRNGDIIINDAETECQIEDDLFGSFHFLAKKYNMLNNTGM